MPQLLRHIDAIARKEGRDALYVIFFPFNESMSDYESCEDGDAYRDSSPDWETLPIRKQIIEWLDSQKYSWEPCGEVASENSISSYRGTIYINVPYDEGNLDYQKLRNYFENPDGSMRYEWANFCVISLASAMENAHHDEPGFWEKWAEKF